MITGGSGADMISGGSGADSIIGGAGADSISVAAGNDTIVGAQDDVLLDGGADADVLQVGANFDDISNAQIANIEMVALTATGLTVSMDAQIEGMTITGFAIGASTITGGSGADSIIGGAGIDSLVGGSGADTITGGLGQDHITLTEAVDAVDRVVFAGAFTAGNASADTITDFTFGAGLDLSLIHI